jgi:hypothetical protein
VSNARTGWGSRAHRNAIEDVSTGSFMLSSFEAAADCPHLRERPGTLELEGGTFGDAS